jgi:chemotaxis protein CheZ
MTSAADDDLEALFDELAAQRAETVTAPSLTTASPETLQAEEPPANTEQVSEDSSVSQVDKPMFERLGGIVRMLHDSLRELGYDRSLTDVATQITDAQARLEYIGTLTEQAANKVLNELDIIMPEHETLSNNAKNMETRWAQLFDGELSVEEFKKLANDSKEFAASVASTTESQKGRLLQIMMAQDFQDLTGQLIKKIVTITNVAESELAQLLKDNAPPEMKAAMAAAEAKPVELLNGPSMPTAAMEQDDVDSLLADLGF